MPFDGIVVSAIAQELKEQIINGKIEKVYQPESDEINILIRCMGSNYKLLISASSNHPRIHLSTRNKVNPTSPPTFCMFLRKHLQGGRIIDVSQHDFERIVTIDIETYDELGYLKIKRLIVEIMGKHSNIILLDQSQNKILDSIKRISGDINRFREVLPGKTYINPPSQNKKNPLSLDFEQFCSLIKDSTLGAPIYKCLYGSLQGVSPLAAREVCYSARLDEDRTLSTLLEKDYFSLWTELNKLLAPIATRDFTPNIIISKDDHHVVDFYPLMINSYSQIYEFVVYDTISGMLEEYYIKRDLFHRLKQKSTDLRKFTTHTIDKQYKKKQKLEEELIIASKSQKLRIFGELLTANLHQMKKGDSEIEVINFYDENAKTLIIPLNIQLTPSQNAQKYFKKYSKAKNALKELQKQLAETNNEILYFENLFHSIENVTSLEDIEEIRGELMEEGYLKKRKNTSSSKKKVPPKPMSFTSSNGFQILVGKNNMQNDQLTLKIASKRDLWFHTKDIPGSHVVIISNNQAIPDATLLEAAELAAFHSKGKMSSNVPVDYTEIKNVKKPKGAKPGMVIYENNKTLYVTPRQNITDLLEKNKSKSI